MIELEKKDALTLQRLFIAAAQAKDALDRFALGLAQMHNVSLEEYNIDLDTGKLVKKDG